MRASIRQTLLPSLCLAWFVLTVTNSAQASAAQTAPPAADQAIGRDEIWPLSLKAGATSLTLYQPQIDSWDGYKLVARLAARADGGGDQTQTHFGILQIEAHTLTDKAARTAMIDNVRIQKAEFPSASAQQAQDWSNAIATYFNGKSRFIALDRLEASLAIASAERLSAQNPLRNAAPSILFSTIPAILIVIDGDPVYHAVPGTALTRVVNTRPLLLRGKDGIFSLKVFDGWMNAQSLSGPWAVASQTSDMSNAFAQTSKAHAIDALTGQGAPNEDAPKLADKAPAIYVATHPADLIVTQGDPQYAPIAATRLLYVTNTTGNIFKDTSDNRSYVLVSGRWFRSSSASGPWEYVAANALPGDFARIPDDSAKENVKASVAGTAQAQEAAIAASIPQVASVTVANTTMPPPLLDGAATLKKIDGTALSYVANSPTPILSASDQAYYAVENGVWFVASSMQGPWKVAASVPVEIYSIPPSSPLYYVTFVRVYDATPTEVYVGYTPGYQGTYVDAVTGTVVYGTGYVYDPWIGTVWYGSPVTYGYAAAVTYTPWTGWAIAFGLGWAWGAATTSWGWGWGPYPYWGPWAYPAWGGVAFGVHGGAVAWGPGGWAGYSGNIYSQWGNRASVSRVSGGFDAWTGNRWAGQVGASYNSRTGVASAGQRGAVGNVYSGNYAAGSRGAAVGPNGNIVVGGRGTAGNAYNGNQISGGGGAVINKNTGDVTTFGHATGPNGGTVAHVGDDVYAGKDGNVYRNTGDGWQKHTSGGGWSPVAAGSAEGAATRGATGGLGSEERTGSLDAQRSARQFGEQRSGQLRQSTSGMQRSFRGGGFRRR